MATGPVDRLIGTRYRMTIKYDMRGFPPRIVDIQHTSEPIMNEDNAPVTEPVEQPAPANETPAEAFKRLAIPRVTVAIKRIQLIGNLSNRSSYEYTEAQIEKIFGALQAELDAARKRFASKAVSEPEFSFDED